MEHANSVFTYLYKEYSLENIHGPLIPKSPMGKAQARFEIMLAEQAIDFLEKIKSVNNETPYKLKKMAVPLFEDFFGAHL